MTVRASADGAILLEGSCPGEDAEALLQQLLAAPTAAVDIRRCDSAHTAVIQVLMAFKPKLLGPPGNHPMWQWVYASLNSRPPN
jgi:hypothetical protein